MVDVMSWLLSTPPWVGHAAFLHTLLPVQKWDPELREIIIAMQDDQDSRNLGPTVQPHPCRLEGDMGRARSIYVGQR